MHYILLSGGSGKRLWPLSNDVRSKQFIKLFHTENGEYESMIQRVYRQIKEVDHEADVTIATGKTQVSSLIHQLGENISLCVEPCRRDTFPAIALAGAYLADLKGVSKEEPVVVLPVDPYVERNYFEALRALALYAEKAPANLVLLGIEPTYASEKYGYIIPEDHESPTKVKQFREKPNRETAEQFIEQGALWNGGVFAFRLGWLLEKTKTLTGFDRYDDLLSNYETLPKISFDYAVVEKEENIEVTRFSGTWKDLGTWNTLTETMDEAVIGNASLAETCENVHVLNELDIPVIALGLRDVVISASPEGILVSDKKESSYIKPFVDQIHQDVRFAEKSWGTYRVLEVSDNSLTIKAVLKAGVHMNYHSHEKRDEVWIVVNGKGRTIVDGMEQLVSPGDVITMQAGCRHTVIAETDMELIEVQIGADITASDKKKFDLEW